MNRNTAEKDERAKGQARAQLDSIVEMVTALDTEDEEAREDAQQKIYEDPLSVQIREGWHLPGENVKPEEFEILLCWGGPAARIIGELDEHGQPENPVIQYQDWFTGWIGYYDITKEEREAIQVYCEQFLYEC